MGGRMSPALKGTGYDGIVFTGAAERPVYLYLDDGSAELRDASHLWGEDTFRTEQALKEELGDARVEVMCIGPAGENLVKYASVVTDRGSLAGRCGMGAVMGSKRLKAVAVRGREKPPLADEAAFKRVRKEVVDNIHRSLFADGLNLFGTTGGVDLSTAICDIPVKNWRQAQWDQGMESLSGVRDGRHHPHRPAFLLRLPHRLQARGGDKRRGVRHARGPRAGVRVRGRPGLHAPHRRHARGGQGQRAVQRLRHGRHLHRGDPGLRHRGLPGRAISARATPAASPWTGGGRTS